MFRSIEVSPLPERVLRKRRLGPWTEQLGQIERNML